MEDARMKKGFILAGIALILAAAGVSAGYLQNRDPKPATSAALAPKTAVETVAGQSSAGCGCCSGPAGPTAAGSSRSAQIEAYLTDFYTNILGDGVSVQVVDLGCHHEASVIQGGKVMKRLSISGNSITDIT